MKMKTCIKVLALSLGVGGLIQLALAQTNLIRTMEELNLLVSRNYAGSERTGDLPETIEKLAPILKQSDEQLIFVPYRGNNGQITLKAIIVPKNYLEMAIIQMAGDGPLP